MNSSLMVTLIGMICFAESVMETVDRYRVLTWIVTFLTCMFVISFMNEKLQYRLHHPVFWQLPKHLPLVAGVVLLVAALIIYQRKVEI